MWKPYLNVIAAMLPAALNVLDRFHIAKSLIAPIRSIAFLRSPNPLETFTQ
jgi:transposase